MQKVVDFVISVASDSYVRVLDSWLFWLQCYIYEVVAHNCHGKTKSHGTTNLSHGKTKLTHGKTKLTHGKTKLSHGKTKLSHGKTKSTHGKTKKTSWSAVGQRFLFASERVCRVTVTH